MLIDDLLKLNRSSRNTIYGVILIIAVIAVYNWAIVPRTNYLSAAQKYETVADDLVRKTRVASGAIRIQNSRLNKLHRELEHAYNDLFTPAQSEEFFRRLQLIASNAGCAIDALHFDDPKPDEKQSELVVPRTVKLTVIGQYDNIVGFLAQLQLNDKKVWIKSLAMETTTKDTGQLKCALTFAIYSIAQEESAIYE